MVDGNERVKQGYTVKERQQRAQRRDQGESVPVINSGMCRAPARPSPRLPYYQSNT